MGIFCIPEPINAKGGASTDSWEYVMQEMCEKGFRCIAHDQRGYDRFDQPWRGYDYITLADDLAALLEKPRIIIKIKTVL